jgi:hypothetical protein
MKSTKLKRHLENKYSEMKNKPEEYFRRNPDEIRIEQNSFVNTAAVSSKALLASYQVSYREAWNKKPHKRAETLMRKERSNSVFRRGKSRKLDGKRLD